ncbi:MAG TPA: hypothetical protein VL358_10045 [Caulobacteraceae bacterium]|jgi:hypothetical protein|nr:hypothetical protein [Caulobacteraceae bacterium]
MTKTLLCTAAFALSISFAGAAAAQNDASPASAAPPTSAPSASAGDPADPMKGLKEGMSVTDNTGAAVGTIARIGKTADGTPAAELSVDGKTLPISLAALSLAPSGDHAVVAASKAQVEAAAGKSGG